MNNFKLVSGDYTLVDGENGTKKVELTEVGRTKLFKEFLKKGQETLANSHSKPYFDGMVRNVNFAKDMSSGFSTPVLKLYNSFQVKLTTLPKDVVGVAVDTNETSNTALKDFRASMPGEPSYENTVNQALEQLKKQPFNEATMKKVNAELAAQGASYKVTSYVDLFYHYAKVIAKKKQEGGKVDGSLGLVSVHRPEIDAILKKKIDIKATQNVGQGSGNGVEGKGDASGVPSAPAAPGGSSVPAVPTGSVPPAGSAPAPSNTFGTNFYRQETGKDFGQFLMDGLKLRKHGGLESEGQKVAVRQVEPQKPQNLGDFLTDGLKLRKSVVQSTKVDDFNDVDNAFFAAGEKLSQQNVEEDAKNRQFVAANKGFFTLDDQSPKPEKTGFFSKALNAAKNFFKSPELSPEQQEMAELRKSIPKKSFFGSLFG
jgi:hypothetical protein